MSTAIEITLFIALVLSIILPGVAFLKGERTKGRFKSHLAVNCFTFFGLLGVTVVSTFAGASNVLAASASSGMRENFCFSKASRAAAAVS